MSKEVSKPYSEYILPGHQSLQTDSNFYIERMDSSIPQLDDSLSSLYFKSLDELDRWYINYENMVKNNKLDKFRIPRESLSRYSSSVPYATDGHQHAKPLHRTNVMICHDFKGNYLDLEDLNPQGYFSHPSGHRYHIQFPQLIDQFIYFSHYRVSIPPVNWTNFCHKNGIQIFGCIIVEGDGGRPVMDEIIKRDSNGDFKYVKMFVKLAKHYRFDGYLLNFETSFSSPNQEVKNLELVYFVECLKSSLHSSIPRSQLIWYDALIPNINKVKYINGVSAENDYLLDKVDLFFTNYWWNEQNLQQNLKLTGLSGVNNKIFVGCDVWGRGTRVGGGGYEVSLAVKYIKKYMSNAAIFAPAWTWEYFGSTNFIKNDSIFWIGSDNENSESINTFVQEKTAPVLVSRQMDDKKGFSFYTDFNKGEGQFFNVSGIKQYNENWVNGNLQNSFPIIAYTAQKGASLTLDINYKDAYNGGNCLTVRQFDNNDEDFNDSKTLFKFNNECLLPHFRLDLKYKYKTYDSSLKGHFKIEIKYYMERRKKTVTRPVHDSLRFTIPYNENSSDWQDLHEVIRTPAGLSGEICILDEISVSFKYDQVDEDWILVGSTQPSYQKLPILLHEIIIGSVTFQNLDQSNKSRLSLIKPIRDVQYTKVCDMLGKELIIIEWDDNEEISYYIVYINGSFRGTSHVSKYCFFKKQVINGELIRVDGVTHLGELVKGALTKISI